jgi:acetylornithine deacetylase
MNARALKTHPNASPFSWDVTGKRNLVATWPGTGGGRSLILNGHIDVVPPAAAELWTTPPYQARREGDWLYGRGAGDMKAGLVAIAGAVRKLRQAGTELRGDVHLQCVVEEECGGNGTLQTLIDGATADACVITEPHPDHFTIAQVGVLWFHIDVVGRPAHAAYAATGDNAIDAAYRILAELRKLEVELNADPPPPYDQVEHPINLNLGQITGGDWTSTVPAKATLSCRLACYPGQDPHELQRRVEEAVARVGWQTEIRYDGFVCEGSTIDPSEPLIQELRAAYEKVHGSPPALKPATATTDARHFIRSGIPTVCFGPRGESYHGIDERVSLASMHRCAEVLARFIVAWCGLASRGVRGANRPRPD